MHVLIRDTDCFFQLLPVSMNKYYAGHSETIQHLFIFLLLKDLSAKELFHINKYMSMKIILKLLLNYMPQITGSSTIKKHF